jgi:phage terminase small subunit
VATKTDSLTPKQAKFVELYSKLGNATEAYRQSYNVANMNEQSIGRKAHELTQNGKITAILNGATNLAVQAVAFDRLDVMRHLVELTQADPSKISHVRRLCCRHCHGVEHAYQWRDEAEYLETLAKAMDEHARAVQQAARRNEETPAMSLPSNEGGYGWRKPNKPHPGCPRCHGEGYEDVYFADMSELTGPERRLIAGVERTKDGLKIKMRDQDGALNTIAQILKMLTNRTELSGPDGGPVPMAVLNAVMPVDPDQASRLYQKIMEGK